MRRGQALGWGSTGRPRQADFGADLLAPACPLAGHARHAECAIHHQPVGSTPDALYTLTGVCGRQAKAGFATCCARCSHMPSVHECMHVVSCLHGMAINSITCYAALCCCRSLWLLLQATSDNGMWP